MVAFLDHAITVRDVMWVGLGVFSFLGLVIGTGVVWWLMHEKTCERERERLGEQIRKDYANVPRPSPPALIATENRSTMCATRPLVFRNLASNSRTPDPT
jgi:hypothetical protein